MKRTIVTIGREYGSGGQVIGKMLAERLGVPFYDKRLIAMAAQESGLSEEYITRHEETKTSSLIYNIYFDATNLPLNDQLFIAQSEVIRRVAEEGPCVIVGRCADYVLREREDCLHVFVHAPLADRMRRVVEEYGLEADNVQAHVLKHDKGRAAYHNRFTPNKWGDSKNYHVALNSNLGYNAIVDALEILAKSREGNQ